jgi:nicotinamidase-related amidase
MTMTENRPSTALIVIDVQASFTVRPQWKEEDIPAYLAAQNKLIEGALARGLPIVRVFHVEPEGPFSLASGLIKPIDGLKDYEPALTIHKHAHSAMSGTRLSSWLIENGIRRIIVSGLRTEQCVETTTRDASDRGFLVDYVTEATCTFPIKHASGRTFTSDEIKMRTEIVLQDRFANVVTVDQALERAVPAKLKAAA